MTKRTFHTTGIAGIFLSLAFFFSSSVFISGCSSSSTSPGTTSTVSATDDMQNNTISGTFQKAPSPMDGPTVDSMTITKVRVVMSGLHLHVSDETAAGVGSFMSQPTVVTFVPGSVNSLGSATVPIGVYTQMIFDLYSLNPVTDATLIAGNPAFADFLVGGTATIIVDGSIVKNGTRSTFSYRTGMVRNLKPVFIPSSLITVAEQNYSVDLRFDGKIAFAVTSGKALDPTASENSATIDDQIAKAFIALH
ncbi:MAG: hypothetical protein Q8896_12350 [Bacteroidota bacterium]|nr:hypothetical protein [Bacteroidota bacterium]MDP4234898.1 hypothetical protein [Bacteroidota bacterium]